MPSVMLKLGQVYEVLRRCGNFTTESYYIYCGCNSFLRVIPTNPNYFKRFKDIKPIVCDYVDLFYLGVTFYE